MYLMRTLASAAALDFHEIVVHLKTGDIAAAIFTDSAAIVVEGTAQNRFAWTTSARGTPHLIPLEEFVAQNNDIIVIRCIRRRIDGAIMTDLPVRMADCIEQTLAFSSHHSAVTTTGAALVVNTYIRLGLARSCCKRISLFDVEDLLLGGDLDAALANYVELTRDAYLSRRRRH